MLLLPLRRWNIVLHSLSGVVHRDMLQKKKNDLPVEKLANLTQARKSRSASLVLIMFIVGTFEMMGWEWHFAPVASLSKVHRPSLVMRKLVMVWSLSHVWLFATPRTVTHQAPLSMGFPDMNVGVGFHFLLQGTFLTQPRKTTDKSQWKGIPQTPSIPQIGIPQIVKIIRTRKVWEMVITKRSLRRYDD